MTPVDQEFMHSPETGVEGDCQRACIASLLNLPRERVPHFLAGLTESHATEFERRLNRFLGEHGLIHVELAVAEPEAFFRGLKFRGTGKDFYHLIYGSTPRGVLHAVVGCNGEVAHDPHPSRAGLTDDRSQWTYAFLVQTCNGDKNGR